jgi:hypothetical protein
MLSLSPDCSTYESIVSVALYVSLYGNQSLALTAELLERSILKIPRIQKLYIIAIYIMIVVGDSFQGCRKLVGGAIIGDFADEIFKVDVSAFL